MPAQFETVNSPVTREHAVVTNGVSYPLDNDIVITGVSGKNLELDHIILLVGEAIVGLPSFL